MIIANPIYDTVFKLLMSDLVVARGIISALIGMRVIELRVESQEYFHKSVDTGGLHGLRLDFHATIETADRGRFNVIVELQKAKVGSSALRFRKYLGQQYQTVNEIGVDSGTSGRTATTLPIISIYLLGYKLDSQLPTVTHVARQYRDAVTEKPIPPEQQCKQEFIELLTHDAFFIQIPKIKEAMSTDLERVLSVFDQHRKLEADQHRLEIEPNSGHNDPLLKRIYRILNKAQENPAIEQAMTQEDLFLLEQQDAAQAERKLREESEARLKAKLKNAEVEKQKVEALLDGEQRKREAVEEELERLKKLLDSD